MKQLLFTRESECLRPIRTLVEEQNHRTLIAWTVECAPRVLTLFEARYPKDSRPREALVAAQAWARGDIKMTIAKKAAIATHNAAAEASDPAAIASARAMGHVVGTVHVETHAMGVVMYGLTAFVRANDEGMNEEVIARECGWFFELLHCCSMKTPIEGGKWAPFLLKNSVPRKERLLRLNEENRRVDLGANFNK
jgi:hypothetical protein